jgi:hypothetical protein
MDGDERGDVAGGEEHSGEFGHAATVRCSTRIWPRSRERAAPRRYNLQARSETAGAERYELVGGEVLRANADPSP